MKIGLNVNVLPQIVNQTKPAEQHQVNEIRTLGSSSAEAQPPGNSKKSEQIKADEVQTNADERVSRADEIKAAIIEEASELRYLKYDVIEEAGIIQISVINSRDGSLVRKVPADEIVEFIKSFREDDLAKNQNFDVQV